MEKKTHVIVASLILSILLWLSVSMNNYYSVVIRVPLRVSDLPEYVAIAAPLPKTIMVRVRGTGWDLASAYLSSTPSINLSIPNFDRRKIVYTSRELGYSLDLGSPAQVLGFTPDTVLVVLDKIISKRLPVISRISIEPRSGFMIVGRPEMIPDSVTVSGALRLLINLEAWPTQARVFKNVMNGIDITVPLSDTLSGITKLGARTVELTADIQQIAENTYKNLPIRVIDNADSTRLLLLPPTVDVTVRGGIGTMSQLSADSLGATVDFHTLALSSSGYFTPSVVLPSNLELISIKPDSVQFVIRK